MTKEKVKEFIKNHKKEIVIGCVGVTAAVLIKAVCGAKFVSESGAYAFIPDSKDYDAEEVIKVLCNLGCEAGKVSKDATMYTLWKATEDTAMFADNIFTDSDGDTLKITGALLFGNKVET